ncbi:MAG: hypothetical protein IJZ16_00685 [Clostridia bacterium]|nr:hypothetical protein [Clostridia bacterium]
MPWCPKCKSEYREGFAVCSDCGTELVDSLEKKEYTLLCSFADKTIADKFAAYLNYSKINFIIKNHDDSSDDSLIEVDVDSKKIREAKSAMNAFVNVEEDLFAKQNIDFSFFIGSKSELMNEYMKLTEEADTDEDEEKSESFTDEEDTDDIEEENTSRMLVPESSVIYESKSFKAEESYNTGIMLVCFGVCGIAYGVYSLVKNPPLDFADIILFVFFGAMLFYGIYSIISSSKLRKEAEIENNFIDSVQSWLKENISKADLIAQDVPGESAEMNYFKRTTYIKSRIDTEFPDLDDNFTDTLVEDFYESVFDED